MKFKIDSKIKKDTYFIFFSKISYVLLVNDSRYPWIILVPKVESAAELTDLRYDEIKNLYSEIELVSKFFRFKFPSTVINVAKIGNIVKQLHIHIVARNENDSSWPNPVWGIGQQQKYKKNDAKILIEELKQYFTENYPHKD
jgi:diadenosine tetraphosphate (Ap4A) HIT family hydrolase